MLSLILYLLTSLYSSFAMAEFFDSDGVRIYFTDSKGIGEPVVLVHGYTMSSDMWDEIGISTKLEEKYRVIALDCRGHGNSDKPTHPGDYGPKVGNDIVNLLDHLKLDKAHMVGFSTGAYVVGRLLVTHPDRVSTAIMGSGFFPSSDKEELEYQETLAKDMEDHGDQVMAAVARGWRYDAVTDVQISKITVPVQAVFGSEEINDFFNAQKARLRMPKSSLPTVIIEGADHDSEKAAILHPQFLETLEKMIGDHSGDL